MSNGEIHFRFIIKRKDDDEFVKKPLVDAKIKVVSPPTKPVANFSFKDKGKAKTNTVKKSGTAPSIIQPVLKPLQTNSVSQISQVTSTTTPASQTSSINARPDRSSTSPCYSPSINKDEECDAVFSLHFQLFSILIYLISYRFDGLIFLKEVSVHHLAYRPCHLFNHTRILMTKCSEDDTQKIV